MSPSYIRVRAVVWAYGREQTDRHTDRQTRVITIHFALSTTHAKCKYKWQNVVYFQLGLGRFGFSKFGSIQFGFQFQVPGFVFFRFRFCTSPQ